MFVNATSGIRGNDGRQLKNGFNYAKILAGLLQFDTFSKNKGTYVNCLSSYDGRITILTPLL